MKKKTKIIAVSGGFDPIHIGHVRYLQEAKKLGTQLIVILNSDEFLMKKKGFVFMPFEERAEILRAIAGVDSVVRCVDEDQSVCRTLCNVHPHIFAKGGDRTLENIPERDVCQQLGIEMVFNVGGGKIQSSSELAKKAKQNE